MNIQTYMMSQGIDEEALIEQFRPQAENHAKCGLIFDKVAKLENLELDEGELDAEYTRLAGLHHMDEADVRKSVREKSLINDMLALKASKLIMDTAIKLDAPEEPADEAAETAPVQRDHPSKEGNEKPPAKKPAAKKPAAKKPAAKKKEEDKK
jgi:trigger factor